MREDARVNTAKGSLTFVQQLLPPRRQPSLSPSQPSQKAAAAVIPSALPEMLGEVDLLLRTWQELLVSHGTLEETEAQSI